MSKGGAGTSPQTVGARLAEEASNKGVRFAPAKPRRAFDDIIEQVRDLLQSGELKPGSKLPSERDFAEQLSVSRNTVREALRMLEVAGLVTLKRGATGGAFVAGSNSGAVSRGLVDGMNLTQFSLADIIEARIGLETLIVAKVCERASDEEFDELEEIIQRASTISSEVDWPGRLAAHLHFHERLADLTQNPLLPILFKPLLELAGSVSMRLGPFGDDFIAESRYRLLAALRSRNADAAIEELNAYLSLLYERWVNRPIDS
ncbi:GntR family transcriptional regulator [Microbacterium sp. NPDC076895]|uniref:FadR/GntR family transcriptional regulator n=1 Tax=Microbacterium sp. NPDC076895 TaxID=3154957 RepID=UPI003424B02E